VASSRKSVATMIEQRGGTMQEASCIDSVLL
jgi:hypothetical protein